VIRLPAFPAGLEVRVNERKKARDLKAIELDGPYVQINFPPEAPEGG
jgi:hypothetical protein